ncbi:Protein FANTASTIC FOUR like [Actinidia chinensis var. chinensis]|uniref:Protein FANTASTIC FOUR like n=1 Tax=Actinidia chinensis var. chinensis TaxID=1590841 RepID=A0A2R6PEP3_ACTCC|nr:Protein FANTASTIC FOUR like [Actinidia chinensis var. chinensis]
MAACGSLQHIFKNPLPENPTLLESLSSWNQIKSTNPIEDSSFTEIFGELHFKENPDQPPPPSTLPLSSNEGSTKNPSSDYFSSVHKKQYYKNNNSFSSMNLESLHLCTESLGFESSDDVEDFKAEMNNGWKSQEERISVRKSTGSENLTGELRRSRTSTGGEFPPPISCIGESGKPWVHFKSYRQDGRFVLKEIRVPTREFLHARRENGCLKLQFFQTEDEILEDEDEEEEDEEEENGEKHDDDDDDGCGDRDHDSDEIEGNEEERL